MSTLTVKELSHPAGQVIKISAGKTLDLKSQGSVTMPTGSVLQVVSNNHTQGAHVSSSSTSYVALGSAFELSITPKFSNSLIICEVDNGMVYTINDIAVIAVITKGGAVTNSSSYSYYNRNRAGQHYSSLHMCASSVAGSTSAITYGMSYKIDGSGTCYGYHGGSAYHIKLTEIAQ